MKTGQLAPESSTISVWALIWIGRNVQKRLKRFLMRHAERVEVEGRNLHIIRLLVKNKTLFFF